MQIFFFLKPLQQKFAVPRVQIPVQIAEIVAAVVLPVISEFDTAAGLSRPPLSHQFALKYFPRNKRQVFKASQKMRIKQRHGRKITEQWAGRLNEVYRPLARETFLRRLTGKFYATKRLSCPKRGRKSRCCGPEIPERGKSVQQNSSHC